MKDAAGVLNEFQMGVVYLSEIGDSSGLSEMQNELEQFILQYPELATEARGVLDALYLLA